jgi:hypothetical protein
LTSAVRAYQLTSGHSATAPRAFFEETHDFVTTHFDRIVADDHQTPPSNVIVSCCAT